MLTPGGGGETFAERINFGGNYNEGGDVAEQTESLFPDNFNMYGGSGVIYIKYTDGERIIEIPFFNGIPMAVIQKVSTLWVKMYQRSRKKRKQRQYQMTVEAHLTYQCQTRLTTQI